MEGFYPSHSTCSTFFRLARLYHPDKNPAGRDKFVGIQVRLILSIGLARYSFAVPLWASECCWSIGLPILVWLCLITTCACGNAVQLVRLDSSWMFPTQARQLLTCCLRLSLPRSPQAAYERLQAGAAGGQGPQPWRLLLLLRAQCVLFRRAPDVLQPFK